MTEEDKPKILIGKLELKAIIFLAVTHACVETATIKSGETPSSIRKRIEDKIDSLIKQAFEKDRSNEK